MKPMAKRLVVKALINQGCYKASERDIREKVEVPAGLRQAHNCCSTAQRGHRWRHREHHP
jgi:hypothetical protein